MDPQLLEKADAVRKERAPVKGNPEAGFAQCGKVWAAILSEYWERDVPPIDPVIVGLMLAGMKNLQATRRARDFRLDLDEWVDCINYMSLAFEVLRDRVERTAEESHCPSAEGYDRMITKGKLAEQL